MSQLSNSRGNNGDSDRSISTDQVGNPSARSAGKSAASKQISVETMWDESGFPRRHKGFHFEKDALNERWKSWHRQITSQLLTVGTSWLLHGPSGSGKTQLSTECARDVTFAGSSSYYIPFNWMGLEIDSAHQPAATQTVATYGRKLLSPRLLVVDSISFSTAEKPHLDFLANLVGMRHDNCLDTIIVSSDETESFYDVIASSVLQKMKTNDGIVKFSWNPF